MKYDFDKVIKRKGTHSIKWEFMDIMFNDTDLLPLWVADMDFECPVEVIKAVGNRAAHGIYGYSSNNTEEYYNTIINWMKDRHGWEINKDWIVTTSGVVSALAIAVQSYTEPGDNVIIQRPVYYPFTNVVVNNDRNILNNSLKYEDGIYTMDFDDLEVKAKDSRTKLMLLCSPHNPVGRVWSHEELKKVGEICINNDVILVSDEIHGDLILRDHKHIPITSISKEFSDNTIVCTAPSKTFNLAGLHTSHIIIENKKLRYRFKDVLINKNAGFGANPFGIVASQAAYAHGKDWLDQVLDYIEKNVDYIEGFCKDRLPGVRFIKPQGTYLVWLDFNDLNFSKEELTDIIINKAKVALDEGYIFGDEGVGFERINVACPRSILQDCMKRIEEALKLYLERE